MNSSLFQNMAPNARRSFIVTVLLGAASAVAGLLPDGVRITGELLYRGVDLLQDRQKHRALRGTAIAMVPQNPAESLYPLHTVGAQFRFMMESHGQKEQWR